LPDVIGLSLRGMRRHFDFPPGSDSNIRIHRPQKP
jgi:hypothetical protein